jgi:hypothetical protein
VYSWRKSADDELLPTIDAQLDPRACALSRLVRAVLTLRYNAFESLLANGSKHLVGGNVKLLREPNVLVPALFEMVVVFNEIEKVLFRVAQTRLHLDAELVDADQIR